MQNETQSLQWNKHTTTWCSRHTISWKDEEANKIHKMDTTFYIADTIGPAILGLPSCSRLTIVHLNCSVQFRKHGKLFNTCPERKKIQQGMKNLKPINSSEDMIKAYPNSFEGIGKFPGTHHMQLKAIVPVTELTDWVSSLTYSWKGDSYLRTCLNPAHLNKTI